MKQGNSELSVDGDQVPAGSRHMEIITVDTVSSSFGEGGAPSVMAWKSENSAAVQEFNRFVAKFGLLLTEFRKF